MCRHKEVFCFHPTVDVLHPTGYHGGVLGERDCFTELYLHHACRNGVLGKAPQHCSHESSDKVRLSIGDAEQGVLCLPRVGARQHPAPSPAQALCD